MSVIFNKYLWSWI